MKKVCLALLLAVACKTSTPSTSPPSEPAPPATDPAPAPTDPAPTEPAAPAPTPMTPTPAPTPVPMTPTPTPTPTPAGGSAAQDAPGIAANCGAGDTCAKGLECVKYYGIAGARGPQFKTCEARCDKKQACPSGTSCVTIADGPGQVCRAGMRRP